jgi:hypothetical protein
MKVVDDDRSERCAAGGWADGVKPVFYRRDEAHLCGRGEPRLYYSAAGVPVVTSTTTTTTTVIALAMRTPPGR